MTDNFITEDYLKQNDIIADSPEVKALIIPQLIDQHYTADMINGFNYYNNDNDIKDRKLYYWEDGTKTEDTEKTNNKIPHNWHKLLVDQKCAYLVGKPISFGLRDSKDDVSNKFLDQINSILEDDFDDEAAELMKEASNKGIAWLQVYIEKVEDGQQGALKYVSIPSEEIIPVWDTERQKDLVELIRYYTITINDAEFIRAEWWTTSDVTYFIETDDGSFTLDPDYEVNPAPHFVKNKKAGSWGKVPFVCFKNNKELKNDLTFYKELADVYDLINSDIANNIEEIQQLVTIIKNYDGADNKELLENLRYYKLIKVSEGGGVDTLKQDIPIQAFNEFADRLEENIFLFGQGVNVKSDKFGNAASGIALKFMFAMLDLKSGITERKFRKGLRDLIEFIALYCEIKDNAVYDAKQITIIFNRSILINELEMSQIALTSKGVISDETLVAHHPWVDNPTDEIKRLDKQRESYVNLDNTGGNNGGQE